LKCLFKAIEKYLKKIFSLMMEHFPLVDRLHTDVLEEKYGKINSKVLVHNNEVRLAHLIDKKEYQEHSQ